MLYRIGMLCANMVIQSPLSLILLRAVRTLQFFISALSIVEVLSVIINIALFPAQCHFIKRTQRRQLRHGLSMVLCIDYGRNAFSDFIEAVHAAIGLSRHPDIQTLPQFGHGAPRGVIVPLSIGERVVAVLLGIALQLIFSEFVLLFLC